MVDMDGLKAINDRHGHLTGSRALCRLADALHRVCREVDTAARFGGDEFVLVLPDTDAEGGRRVLGRIYNRLAADPDTPAISVSGGIAAFPDDGDNPTALVRAADRILYEEKSRLYPEVVVAH
jgi:diguanylate cyclase (GGDEF)-like protein